MKKRGMAWSRKMPPAEIVAEDVASGLTTKEMAEKYGVSQPTILSFMSRFEIRRERKRCVPEDDVIVAALNDGLSVLAISEKFKCRYATLLQYIKRHGLFELVDLSKPAPALTGVRETADKIVIERLLYSYESGVKPRKMLISLPRIKTIHGEFRP